MNDDDTADGEPTDDGSDLDDDELDPSLNSAATTLADVLLAVGPGGRPGQSGGLNLSAVTQEAVRQTLAARSTDSWLSTPRPPSTQTEAVRHDRAIEALDEARAEPVTRHG